MDIIPERQVIDFTANRHGELLCEFLIDTNCCMLNGRNPDMSANEFTCIRSLGSSVVDYCLVPHEDLDKFTDFKVCKVSELINKSEILNTLDANTSKPDHSILTWRADFGYIYEGCSKTSVKSEYTKFDRTIPNTFLIDYIDELSAVIQDIEGKVKSQVDLDCIYTNFVKIIDKEMHQKLNPRSIKLQTGVSNKKRRIKKPWWTDNLTSIWNELCLREKTMLKCRNDKRKIRAEFLTQRKLFNAEVQRAKRAHWKMKQVEIEELESTNPKRFWKEIGKIGIGQDRRKDIPMEVKLPNGDISTNVKDVMNVWKTGFETLLNASNGEVVNELRYVNTNLDNSTLNSDICETELKLAVNRLKCNKAAGIDELPAEILKCERLTDVLLKLFNKCFSTGLIPDIWKKGIINPIPKSSTADRRDPLNYRGITLTSSVYKLYCNILNDRLSKWENSNNILLDNQNGFRKNRSTVDHVMTITSIIETRKLNKKNTFAAFIDFRKAYDNINRNLLFEKMRHLGINGSMYKALIAIYDNVRCSVRLNGIYTEWFEVRCGIKQGCALSSILFNLYINDLLQRLNELNVGIDIEGQKLSVLAYADDVVLLAETESDLQVLLDELNLWCINNKMEINQGKSKIMHFRNPSTPRTERIYACGESTLEIEDSYMYLGLLLTQHLDYSLMAKQVSSSASRALGLLISKCKSAGGLPFSTFTKLYDSTVGSIIAYGAAVWGCKKYQCITAV